ncbi:hypothetical protein OAG56_00410 [Mariniblastus sp.]|nr:hypothetical protein [Mariniblastus sp.]MDB4755803.1 hypothetical protein [Mariniblastus sp.]
MRESVTTIGVKQAQRFLNDTRSVQLSLYDHLDDEAAKILGQSTSPCLCLDGIRDLSEEAARYLGQFAGNDLSLNHLPSLTEPAAQGLNSFSGALHLNALRDMPPTIAQALTKHCGPLYLDNLRTLSTEAASILVQKPEIHLRLSQTPSAKTVTILKESARLTGRMCKPSQIRIEGLVYTNREWPPPMPRRDFYIQNDDPTTWCMSSAIYQAMDGRETVEDARKGWFLKWEVEEINILRFILEDGLTLSEQCATLASGYWPLLRIPDGVLLVGTPACGRPKLKISPKNEFEVQLAWHDRFVVVRVPPGCYSVGIHQHFNSWYTFTLHRFECACSWDPEKVRTDPQAHADCPDYIPLAPAPGVRGWTPQGVNGPTSGNHVGSAMGIRHGSSPPKPSARLQRAKIRDYPSALYCDVDETRAGWTQTLPNV